MPATVMVANTGLYSINGLDYMILWSNTIWEFFWQAGIGKPPWTIANRRLTILDSLVGFPLQHAVCLKNVKYTARPFLLQNSLSSIMVSSQTTKIWRLFWWVTILVSTVIRVNLSVPLVGRKIMCELECVCCIHQSYTNCTSLRDILMSHGCLHLEPEKRNQMKN